MFDIWAFKHFYFEIQIELQYVLFLINYQWLDHSSDSQETWKQFFHNYFYYFNFSEFALTFSITA
jgi:hypothetical protein